MGTYRKLCGSTGLRLVCLFTMCLATKAQTQIDLSKQSKNVDFSAAAATRPVKVGASLPSTCLEGEAFYSTTAPLGANLYLCGTTNNWVSLNGSGNALMLQNRALAVTLPTDGQVLTWAAGAARWQPGTVPTSGATDPVSVNVTGNRITLAAGAKARLGVKESTLTGTCGVDTTSGTGSVWFYLLSNGQWTAGTNVAATLVAGSTCQLATSITAYPPSSVPVARVAVTAGTPGAIEPFPQVTRTGLPIIAGANCAVTYTTDGAAQISCTPGTNGLADPLSNGIVTRNAANATVARTIGGTSGRVTVTNGDGVAGNPAIDLATAGVTAGTYNNAAITVDAYGRLTAATSRTITGTSGRVAITNGDGVAGNPTIDLATAGVTAGTYNHATVTVDAYGRLTSAASGSASVVTRSAWAGLPTCNSTQANNVTMVTDTAGVSAHCDGVSYLYFSPNGVINPPALKGTLTTLNGATVTSYGGNRYLTGASGADPNLRAAVTSLPGSWQAVEIGFQILNLDSSNSHACGLVLSETAAASSKAALVGLSNAARHTVLTYTTFTSGVTAVQAVMPFTNLLAVQNPTTTQFYRVEKNGANFDVSISSDRTLWRKFATGVAIGFTPGFYGLGCDPRGSSGQPGIMGTHLEVF